MTVEDNLKKINISLPNAPDPVGAYVAYKKTGNLCQSFFMTAKY